MTRARDLADLLSSTESSNARDLVTQDVTANSVSATSFSGTLTGNVTGNVTGNLSGVNVAASGNVTSSSLTSTTLNSTTVTVSGTMTSANNYSNTYVESVKAVSQPLASQAVTLDLKSHQNFTHTLANNVTYTFANPPVGSTFGFTLKLKQDAGGSGYTVAWPGTVDWPAATAPTLSSGANAVDILVFLTNDGGTTYYGFTSGQALG